MKHQLEAINVDSRNCWIATPRDVGLPEVMPVLYFPTSDDFVAQYDAIMPPVTAAVEAGACRPFVLAAFACGDWNMELTPWPAPALFKKEGAFGGGAGSTLQWLFERFMPEVESSMESGAASRAIIGYSLAGLFALWATLSSDRFGGCASCSGSLWYDGWLDWMRTKSPPEGSRVYLSLGEREGKARNPRMASVEPCTREAAELLAQSPNVTQSVLAWHTGGHFDGVEARLADALLWLMRPQPV